MNKFLRVDYGDNDFGLVVQTALERLWKFIRKNNSEVQLKYMGNGKTLPEIFIKLHNQSYLEKMIKKAYDCEYNWFSIEGATRGLYDKVELHDWQLKGMEPELAVISNYLSCKISFHTNNKFSFAWNNGESACLNLITGKCKTF